MIRKVQILAVLCWFSSSCNRSCRLEELSQSAEQDGQRRESYSRTRQGSWSLGHSLRRNKLQDQLTAVSPLLSKLRYGGRFAIFFQGVEISEMPRGYARIESLSSWSDIL